MISASRHRQTSPSHGPYPVAERLLALAVERPDDIALSDGTDSVTYGQLVHDAARVAAMVGHGTDGRPVAVLVDRSVRSVVAIVGVQWAGRTIVPLDRNEPEPRLLHMLDRADARLVVDATGTADAAALRRHVTRVDHLPSDVRAIDPCDADPAAPCTMFFTSGSTGAPKAIVRNGHEGRVTWRLWDHPRLIGAWTHLGVFAPLHFAAGYLFAVLMPALGRRVTLVDLAATSLRDLPEVVERSGVDSLALTPSLVSALRSSISDRRLQTVRHVMTFGEGLEWSMVADIRALCADDVVVQSLYGSSESLGMTVEHTIPAHVTLGSGSAPLGTPLDPGNLRLDDVEGSDDMKELVAVRDVVGGYWGDPVLTAQRFGIDEKGQPFWRSGDLVTVDEGGILHFRGRLDDMVKVNGRLVEPAETERVLHSIDGVRDAVVLPQRLGESRTRLVAHLEVDDHVTPDAVHHELRRRLPAHLIPGVLVRHERLPVSDRGKVDRGALRQHTVVPWRSPGDSDTLRGSRRAVTTEVDAVTAVAASVLQVPDLGPDDDLWHAGCDSLCALEILHLVNSAYGAHLDANVFVEATTPRAIADRLEQREDHPPVVAYNLDGSRPPLHLIAGAGAPALQYRSLIWALGADQPVVVHEQAGLHQRMPRDRSIRAHARRCADDVIAHQSEGPYTVAGHSYGGGVAIEVVALLTAAGQATRLILLDTLRPPSPLPPRQEPARALWQRLRFHLRAPLLPRVREFAARLRRLWHGRRVGSHHRYELFVHHANVLARHHRPSPVDAPTLVLVTEESRHLVAGDPPHRTVVQVPGGHTSLVYPPHVGEVAACLTAWMSAMR